MDTGQHLLHLEGLDDIVVRPLLQTGDLVLGLPFGGEHDDRGPAPLPNLFQHRPAVHNGQHNVQQHQIGLEGAEQLDPLAPVLGHLGLEALLLQIEVEQLGDIGVVLDNQNLLGHEKHPVLYSIPLYYNVPEKSWVNNL